MICETPFRIHPCKEYRTEDRHTAAVYWPEGQRLPRRYKDLSYFCATYLYTWHNNHWRRKHVVRSGPRIIITETELCEFPPTRQRKAFCLPQQWLEKVFFDLQLPDDLQDPSGIQIRFDLPDT